MTRYWLRFWLSLLCINIFIDSVIQTSASLENDYTFKNELEYIKIGPLSLLYSNVINVLAMNTTHILEICKDYQYHEFTATITRQILNIGTNCKSFLNLTHNAYVECFAEPKITFHDTLDILIEEPPGFSMQIIINPKNELSRLEAYDFVRDFLEVTHLYKAYNGSEAFNHILDYCVPKIISFYDKISDKKWFYDLNEHFDSYIVGINSKRILNNLMENYGKISTSPEFSKEFMQRGLYNAINMCEF